MCGPSMLHTRSYSLQNEGWLQSANKHNTANMSAEDGMHMQSLVSRIPPLIPFPQPGHWLPINTTNITDIKAEHNKDIAGYQSLHLKCSSCLAIVHSSQVPSSDIGHPLCLPCWSVMAMALDHLPLIRRQTYGVESDGEKRKSGLGVGMYRYDDNSRDMHGAAIQTE